MILYGSIVPRLSRELDITSGTVTESSKGIERSIVTTNTITVFIYSVYFKDSDTMNRR